jgi:hypothetical protein
MNDSLRPEYRVPPNCCVAIDGLLHAVQRLETDSNYGLTQCFQAFEGTPGQEPYLRESDTVFVTSYTNGQFTCLWCAVRKHDGEYA